MSLSSLLNTITCISFYQLALVAFFNPGKFNQAANKWFALCFFAAGCMMLNWVLYEQNADATYARLIAFNELSRFALAPALYLAVVQLVSPDKGFKAKHYLHFIPFALFFIYLSPFVITNTNNFWTIFGFLPEPSHWLPVLIALTLKLQLLIYLALSIYRLRRHQKDIKLINADTAGIDLNWLQYLIFSLAAMLLSWYSSMLSTGSRAENVESAIYLAGTLLAGYFLLAQKEVYPFEAAELEEIAEVISPEKYAGTQRFTEEELIKHKDKLLRFMQMDRIYLNNGLNLPELAAMMHISSHDLSYVLNKGLNASFFEYINSYRVEEAKRLMLSKENDHLNMLGIAYGAGFNSKTTFYTVFKKKTGLSPRQFITHAKEKAVNLKYYVPLDRSER
ncbi:MAG: helix-turn-helix domain-containing protein [Bacteroidota bacterium]|nr:helix-turn-helix domain-containing protein [Bacteroidota bacterium]